MIPTPSPPGDASPAARGGEILVVVEPRGAASPFASSLQERLSRGADGRDATVLVAAASPEIALVPPGDPRAAARPTAGAELAAGGVAGPQSALGALLREADRRSAAAAVLVSGDGRDDAVDWLHLLVAPILEDGYEFVCPAYRRGRFDGMLATAILHPLTSALYGVRLRQPAGGEAALSLGFARDLLAAPEWRRDPEHAGSDAWLVARALSEGRRTCQAWLGRWPGDGVPEDASHALVRLVGPAFREMERHAERWQRVDGSRPAPAVGEAGALPDDAAHVDVAALASTFRLGLRELDAIWGLVLPPATRFALRRAATASPEALRVDDGLWARVVYDFAVAHFTRALERRQLLRSMTPLYLGWVAGFVNDVRGLDAAAAEARIEALCAAFEREKRYLIARWRWPDSFNP